MPATVQVHTDIPYLPDGEARHTYDMYLPWPCPDKVPLVVFVHGGAWRTGDKSEFRHVALGLIQTAGHRLAVAVINYDLSTRTPDSVRHPQHFKCVLAAVNHLVTDRHYIGRSSIDHHRIYLVGHSAGAHLLMLMALSQLNVVRELDCIKGVVGIGGIYDIPVLLDIHPEYKDFIDMAFSKGQHVSASPTHLAKGMYHSTQRAKFVIINSIGDELIDPEQATGFASKLIHMRYDNVYLISQRLGLHDDSIGSKKFWKIVVDFITTDDAVDTDAEDCSECYGSDADA
ncbi:hypothetical protein LPJ61_006229 [Coemansia biformis]|uniref:BD-FAE-like domain-containing protein n=1 Tax=Coemansia biformis TaxID=1286918 RepID=A0A9W7XWX7_9FUNG|nr:hypothetical protein LPJ61_006229 [Coemansia biformis]